MADKKPIVQYNGQLTQLLDTDPLISNAGIKRSGVAAGDVAIYTDALTNEITIGRAVFGNPAIRTHVLGDFQVDGSEVVVGGTTFEGDVQIGNATTDTLAIVSGIEGGPLAGPNAPILPGDDSGGGREVVIGSGAKRLRSIHSKEYRADDTGGTDFASLVHNELVFSLAAGGSQVGLRVDPPTTLNAAGNALVLPGGNSDGSGTGGNAVLIGGQGGTTGVGGEVHVYGGYGGSASGAGGAVQVIGGNASGGDSNGGNLLLEGGNGIGTGVGGDVYVRGGTGSGTGSANGILYFGDSNTKEVHLGAGGATTPVIFDGYVASNIIPTTDNTRDLGSAANRWANVHSTVLTTHADTTNTNKVYIDTGLIRYDYPVGGGKFDILASQVTTASTQGNEVAVTGGEGGNAAASSGGKGGQASLTGGRGGSDSATPKAAGAGGNVRVTGGLGGPELNAAGGNAGGYVYITGGAGTTASTTSVSGGSVVISGGAGTGPAGGGGDVSIDGGAQTGTGVQGVIRIGITRASAIYIAGGTTNAPINFGGTGKVTGSAAQWDLSAATELDIPDSLTATIKIGGVTQGATFTGTNVKKLHDNSDATGLHYHSSGGGGNYTDVDATAKETLVVGQPVLFFDDAGTAKVQLSDANAAGRKDCVGLCSLAAAGDTNPTKIRVSGEIGTTIGTGTYWDTDPAVGDVGKRVYISLTQGKLTYDVSGFTTVGDMILRVGWISRVDVPNGKAYVVLGIGEGVTV